MVSEPKQRHATLAVTAFAAAVASAGLAAPLLSLALQEGGFGLLFLGLTVAALSATALGYGVWHLWQTLSASAASSLSKGLLVGALTVLSEVGLTWLSLAFVLDGRMGPARVVGAVAVLLLVPLTGLVIRHNEMENHERIVVVTGVVLSAGSLGWLAIHLMAGDNPQRTWLLAGLAAVLIVITARLRGADGLSGRPGWLLALVFTSTLLLVVATLAGEGHAVPAWLVGGLGLGGTLGVLGILNDWSLPVPRRRTRHREVPAPSGPPPGAVVPLWARAAGLVVPLGSLGWAALDGTERRMGTGPAELLVLSAGLAVAAVVLMGLQALILGWLRPGCTPGIAERAASRVGRLEIPYDDPRQRRWPGPEEHLRDREFALREHVRHARSMSERDMYERELVALERDRARVEWEIAQERQARSRRAGIELRTAFRRERPSPGALGLLVRPFSPVACDDAVVDAAFTTGLVVDRVWPRVELVAPPGVRREARRRGRDVALLRVSAASALCTGLGWAFAVGVVARSQLGSGSVAVLVLGPLLVAVAALVLGRRRVVEAYEHRVTAVEVYRFDLAEALRLPLPDSHAELLGLSDVLQGAGEFDRPLAWTGAARADTSQPPPPPPLTNAAVEVSGGSREALVSQVSERVLREVRTALRDEHEALAQRFVSGRLGKKDLARLAEEVARHTSVSVGERLGRTLADLHGSSARELEQALRKGLEEAVSGPPLVNFTGYFALQLDAGQESTADVAAGGGAAGGAAHGTTVVASPGQRLGLVLFVVRDPRGREAGSTQQTSPERQFFALEPVHIEGGRDVPAADFEALVDSPTLTPSPHRRTLRTEREAQTVFRFPLPEEEGLHEVWFQLYQSGRLVQVIAVSIAVRAAGTPDNPVELPGGASEEARGEAPDVPAEGSGRQVPG
ncbi:hypothetical protein AB0D29_17195 [Streptomyces sp. NPDC048424]|uniref:hypothetical protein n=1 Tax=Streptomyces sp. NPDC048424 TaxID=3155265 RepID=UPI00342BB75D